MRLGKTLIAYAEYKMLFKLGEVKWMIIICPNTIKEQWQAAIEEVDPYEPILIYNSQRKAAIEHFFDHTKNTGGVVIINYESIRPFMDANYWLKLDPLKT